MEAIPLSRVICLLLEQGDRVAALSQLKSRTSMKLGTRQRLVNDLQKELRERGATDMNSLAGTTLAALSGSDPPDGADTVAIGTPHRPLPAAVGSTAIHIFGDSHTHVLAGLECEAHAVFAYPFVAGSAMGLRRADSRSGYRTCLEVDLRQVSAGDTVVFKFGQVDLDFVYYLKLVEDPNLSFDAFAADSVGKYMSFVTSALDTFGVDRLILMTPNPTVVTDPHLREALCTLPFMRADFKAQFKAKLSQMTLPSLEERTRYGRQYCDLLLGEAARHQLRAVDVYNCLLGPSGTASLLNADAQHHLLAHHLPLLLPTLDAAFGGRHTQAVLTTPIVPPAEADPLAGVNAAALEWLPIYSEVTSGRRELKLRGHVRGTYAELAQRCGKPMRLTATPEGPQFAAWLVRFPRATVVAHVKGRFTAPARESVWEVEASDSDAAVAIDLVRKLAAGGAVEVEGLPECVKMLQMVQRSSPELFAQLNQSVQAAPPP